MSPSQKNGAQTTSRALRRADGGSRPARVQPRRPEGPKSSIIALKASYYSIRFGSHAHVISPLTTKRGCAGVDRRRVFFRISHSVYLSIYLSISLSIYIYIYICFLLLKQPEGHSHPLSRSYCVSQCILCYVTLLRVRMTNGEHARLALRILQAGAASGVCMVISFFARLALDDLVGIANCVVFFFVCAALLCYIGFQCLCLMLLWTSSNMAARQSIAVTGHRSKAPRNTNITAKLLAASASTTVLFGLMTALTFIGLVSPLICELVDVLDLCSDAGLAMLAASIIGPRAAHGAELLAVGDLVQQQRARLIFKKLRDAARAISGPSLMLAALFDNKDPEDILSTAVERFRAITWDTLADHSGLILDGGTLDGQRAPEELCNLLAQTRAAPSSAVQLSHLKYTIFLTALLAACPRAGNATLAVGVASKRMKRRSTSHG